MVDPFGLFEFPQNERLFRIGAVSMVRLAMLCVVGLTGVAVIQMTSLKDGGHPSLRSSAEWEDPFTRHLQEEECTEECCKAFEANLCDSNSWISSIPFAVQILLIIWLIMMSALFSGLTLGLMSLDKTGLEIVMSGDDAKAANYAKIIYPVREDGNLLLCTLLLGNVLVNALLSILMAEYAGGVVGLLSSTFLIVIFGEIVPQAVCSRYALKIGSTTVPIVKVIRLVLFPVAKPLAMCLDFALGVELATTYSNAEMMKLLQIQVQQNVIDQETAGAMTGALTYKLMTVKEVMTVVERTFMLNVDDKLSFETIAKIFKTGYSRIPIYEITRNNIIGLLFVKDLIFIDPEDEVPLKSFIQIFGRGTHFVWPDDTLGDVLAELKKGSSHLAIVRDVNNTDISQDPFYEVKGIITLEDIIEKIIGDNIVDETDEYVDSTSDVRVERGGSFEWARLRLLDAKIVDELLSPSEVQAVTAHLRMNFTTTVQKLTDAQLSRLVATTPVLTLQTARHQLGKELPEDLMYEKGKPSDLCTLILSGKVTILAGAESFRSDLSSWCVVGKTALENPEFCPDFTAFVSDGPCRILQISRADFLAAAKASASERVEAEKKTSFGNFASLPNDLESHGDSRSAASSDAPNRREKLLAKLFQKESIENPIVEELGNEVKETIAGNEEEEKPSAQEDGNDSSADATTESTENGGSK